MAYRKQTFVDSVVDDSGNVIKEGTRLKAEHFEHIEDGIVANEKALEKISGGNSTNGMNGKVISILGDSISTYRGYIPVADGFNEEHATAYPASDVQDVSLTWWMQVINALGAKLGINESWAGSRVHNYSDVENTGQGVGTKVAMASMTRIANLGSNGTPDLILFYGGTNDARFPPVGEFDASKVYDTVDLEATKWSNFADAYVAAIMRIQHLYPKARLICITPMQTPSAWYNNAVVNSYADTIVKICNYFGVPCIDLRRCGINYANLYNYSGDGVHPSKAGMKLMANYILAQLRAECLLEEGENVVYKVTNSLTGVSTDKPYIVGVSKGNPYSATLTGDNLSGVTVMMGGKNITSSALSGGVVTISSVTGDVTISN